MGAIQNISLQELITICDTTNRITESTPERKQTLSVELCKKQQGSYSPLEIISHVFLGHVQLLQRQDTETLN